MYNVFEDVLPRGSGTGWGAGKRTDPGRALGANMSGTGPTGLGLFDCPEAAEEARAVLAENCRDILCQTV